MMDSGRVVDFKSLLAFLGLAKLLAWFSSYSRKLRANKYNSSRAYHHSFGPKEPDLHLRLSLDAPPASPSCPTVLSLRTVSRNSGRLCPREAELKFGNKQYSMVKVPGTDFLRADSHRARSK
jgi:hypothetical protein